MQTSKLAYDIHEEDKIDGRFAGARFTVRTPVARARARAVIIKMTRARFTIG